MAIMTKKLESLKWMWNAYKSLVRLSRNINQYIPIEYFNEF